MNCVFCGNEDTEVIETRIAENGAVVRRRRVCTKCDKRFTTYERVEDSPILVIKRDGRRDRFDREKLMRGILRATGKTTVTAEQIEEIINQVEVDLKGQDSTEVDSIIIGNLVAKQLKKLDDVAYIRFASVFRRFVDAEDFEKEIKKLI